MIEHIEDFAEFNDVHIKSDMTIIIDMTSSAELSLYF